MYERRKTITFPAFLDYRVVIILTTDKKKTYEKFMKMSDVLPNDYNFTALHIFIGEEKTSYLIFTPKDSDPGTVAHECWHCLKQICSWLGAKVENELIAYHLGYLVNEVYSFIHKKTKKLKK